MDRRLFDTPVLLVDCQTTGMTPARGDLIEIAWAITSVNEFEKSGALAVERFLLRLPEGETLPTQVARLTGLTDEELATGQAPQQLWVTLSQAIERCPRIVAHFARFEQAFLEDLRTRFGQEGTTGWDFLCTHQFAKRALPTLPAWGLKAVTGYLGEPLKESYRARAHVEATFRVWRGLLQNVVDLPPGASWEELKRWMANPAKKSTQRTYLISRDKRLGLTRSPGVYRMVAHDGTILYVGKATSLRSRVNQYFKMSGKRGRLAEMMAQVADLSLEPTETPLEAALFETDEIKRLDPPYNTSLKTSSRTVAYWSLDLTSVSPVPDDEHPFGPFSRAGYIEQLAWLMHASRRAQELDYLFPELEEVEWIFEHLEKQAPRSSESVYPWLRWGRRLLRAGVLDDREEEEISEAEGDEEVEKLVPEWTAESVARRIDRMMARSYQAWQRRRLLLQLADACVAWSHSGKIRYLVFTDAQIRERGYVENFGGLPDASWNFRGRSRYRNRALDLNSLDRLQVLRMELERMRKLGIVIQVNGASQFKLSVNQAPDHDPGRKRRADDDAADGDHLR